MISIVDVGGLIVWRGWKFELMIQRLHEYVFDDRFGQEVLYLFADSFRYERAYMTQTNETCDESITVFWLEFRCKIL